ncbi:MAG: hypothetical protein ACLPWG_21020, partial [Steroidobacteraceae bacterium]
MDLAEVVEHQHSAWQPFHQGGQARRQVFTACARVAQFALQLCDLAAQGVEGTGQLFRDGTERDERRLKFRAAIFDQLEICGCHTECGKQLLCLTGICPAYQPVTKSRSQATLDTSKICQELKRYMRSFSTSVERRMR